MWKTIFLLKKKNALKKKSNKDVNFLFEKVFFRKKLLSENFFILKKFEKYVPFFEKTTIIRNKNFLRKNGFWITLFC